MNPSQALTDLIYIVCACFSQIAVMLGCVVLFTADVHLAQFVYDQLKPLVPYVPALWRYQHFLEAKGQFGNFPILFSVSVANVAIQAAVLTIVFLHFRKRLSIRFGDISRTDLALILLSAICFVPTVQLFTGPSNFNTGFLDIINGPPSVSGYVLFCFALPGANIVLIFLSVMRFCECEPSSSPT